MADIKYLTYQQIDKIKWDACIDKASNGLIYPYSFYLDAMAKHWDALVLNDYDTVMPLTWNKKFGFYYLYQPPFSASLGIFGNELSEELVADFLTAVPEKFKYWDIYLNSSNNFAQKSIPYYLRKNFILDLNNSYENLYNNFRDNIKRNIKKALPFSIVTKKNIPVAAVIELAKEQARTFADIKDWAYQNFENLFHNRYEQKKATTYGVYSKAGQLIAAAAFLFSHNRAYYILVGNHPNGKTLGASHVLINAFIKDHAGRELLLDFEGSDISSLAFFYSSFGAVEELYPAIKLNRLPAPVKWLKK